MKMNNPVDCRGFFVDETQYNREGLWCVSLSPSGQILSLIEANLDTDENIHLFLRTLNRELSLRGAKQLLVVRIDPVTPLFYQQDWDWLELLHRFIKAEGIELCDYLKISKNQHCSLINYDY